MINTKKGSELFNLVKDKLDYEKIDKKEISKNKSYYESCDIPEERNNFYKDLNSIGFKKVSRKYKLKPELSRRVKIRIKNILKG